MAIKPSAVERPRVSWKLRLATRRRVAVVHGHAGCGKSAAIDAHLTAAPGAHVLFAVRAEHAGVAQFVRGFAEALTTVAPAAAQLLPAAYSGARRRTHPWDTVAQWLAEQLTGPLTIAVDQLHRLDDDEQTFKLLARLIESTGPDVRWILGTRSTAAIPLPSWLAAEIGDATVDDRTLRVESSEIPDLAASLQADRAFVESLCALHDGSIGQIVDGVSGAEAGWRRFGNRAEGLVALAALPHLDDRILTQLPAHVSALLNEIDIAFPFAHVRQSGNGVRDLEESVRTRAYAIAERNDASAIGRGRILAARALEAAGRIADALRLFLAADAYADVGRIVDTHGFDLHEHGAADIVAAALAGLPPDQRQRSAIALTLEATDESFRGRYDVSESWFENALSVAQDTRQRMHVDVAFSIDLLRRGRTEAFQRLETLASIAHDGSHEVSILASLAVAHASAGRLVEATRCSAAALAALVNVEDVAIRATVHQRAAFVALMAGNTSDAELHADVAATLAQEHGNDEIVAVARSVSYVVATSHKDDQEAALEALRQIAKAGERLGNAFFRRFASIGNALIFTERCDIRSLAQLDRELAGEELEASPEHVEAGLVPARALRHTWTGEFAAAYELLAPTGGRQPSAELNALRWAEIAFYALIASRGDDATSALAGAQAALAAVDVHSVESLRAALLIGLTSIVLGDLGSAGDTLARARADVRRWPRWLPLYQFLQAHAQPNGADRDPEFVLEQLAAIDAAGLGGFARMIANIPHSAFSKALHAL